jgi:transcriptional regulator of acetoin/glycerol metabolism
LRERKEDRPVNIDNYDNELINENDPPKKTALINALKQANGNLSQAAKILGVKRGTVWNRIKKYGIDMERLVRS